MRCHGIKCRILCLYTNWSYFDVFVTITIFLNTLLVLSINLANSLKFPLNPSQYFNLGIVSCQLMLRVCISFSENDVENSQVKFLTNYSFPSREIGICVHVGIVCVCGRTCTRCAGKIIFHCNICNIYHRMFVKI